MPEITFPPDLPTMAIGKLLPYAKNPRAHDDAQVSQIAASIKEFGFNNPILVDPSGEIIAGHGRVLAAEKLELRKVPVVKLPHLNEDQKRAYRIADNKIALQSEWSIELLTEELRALQGGSFDMGLTGFNPEELANLLGQNDTTWEDGHERAMPGEGENDTEINRITLFYAPETYAQVVRLASELVERENFADMSELFQYLVEKEHAKSAQQ